MKCRYETSNGRCGLKGSYAHRHKCLGDDLCKCHQPMTNADRIRAMSDDELAMQFADFEYRVAKEVCEMFGVDITVLKHDFEAAAKEQLELLKQPYEGD